MPNITFKAKVQTVYNMDDTVAYQYVQVPELKRAHCDMNAFRSHPRFAAYANSDLFPNLLKRAVAAAGVGSTIRLDRPLDCVTVDASGFLARVTINVP
jgi:hypothetical protein